jgi:putative endonuclease
MNVAELNTITYRTFYIYIVTDKERKRIEIDVTGDLNNRLIQLKSAENAPDKLPCLHLVYWESYNDVKEALVREKAIKKLSRKKKKALVGNTNPEWVFLNEKVH